MADTFVTLAGNLTDDPDLRFTPQGNAVAHFRLAVTGRVRDGDNWKDGETSFYRVNVWRSQAEHAVESLTKGARAVVIGRLRSRSWDTPDGERRTIVEIEADEIAVSLRWAIARPERATASRQTSGTGSNGSGQADDHQADDHQADDHQADEEPPRPAAKPKAKPRRQAAGAGATAAAKS